ncbi:hypothetical protein [Porphyromonas levii]|uniref:Uncharacterized protein n=1 Tax=Porphyromonas levii TaxID=28114 RepID=A0A4Y8WQS0_9PORP|nr:hypothetical protein [Porphyromonas levii]TFH96502.1 hypothetical protein E4P47_02150 [Porphyromonas levii]TFH96872.1 hypothetical protein E4P48_03235 [Porphyromonas levii]
MSILLLRADNERRDELRSLKTPTAELDRKIALTLTLLEVEEDKMMGTPEHGHMTTQNAAAQSSTATEVASMY